MKGAYSFKMRATAFVVAVLFVISLFIADLFRIQVIDAQEYASQNIYYSSANTQIEAIRGQIIDTNGKPLVYSLQSNTIYVDGSYFPKASKKQERNEIMLSLLRLLKENEVEYNFDDFITIENGEIKYTENIATVRKKLFAKDYLNLNMYATAKNCFDALCDYYELNELSQEDAIMLATVYVAMTRADFSKNNPYTLAENVPTELVSLIKEQSRFYTGIEVRIDTNREYYDGEIAPHIIGYYDYINAEEYTAKTEEYKEALNDENLTEEEKELLKLRSYGMTDKLGKFGIESAYEDELRGTNGILTTVTNGDGSKTTSVTKAPVNGNNVILTIDGDFQKQVQEILSSKINLTKEQGKIDTAGSIVVMDVHDFSVLACASYPSYNLETYKENIVELNKDKSAPLWNRALRSTYAPGSTAKPCIGFAGLEEGLMTPESSIFCDLEYNYFPDLPLNCIGVGNHGNSYMNLNRALTCSCNTYFYEVGRQLGISKINEYFTMFGLGQKTGVELTEAKGQAASKENREAQGGIWYPGNTVQAAIGQSDNLFTPIQLCSYVATLANGGTRYKAHFVKSVKSYDYSETIYEAEPVVLNKVDGSPSSFAAVREGMISMANSLAAFKGTEFKVASKTGTAQAKKKVDGKVVSYTNGFMISYAPADNPQIAVVIAIENVDSGGLGNYVREVYEAYFSSNSDVTASQQSGVILN
ncbi:MAG: hypothetical protein IJB72_02675 [Clostridia bacterium]|nr:hypothetical protein [Clostridia bacterium]